ncbi:DUF2889 domain-containing protein [Azospirillum doebereinerae]|uniref:DUF2889 domain-containing protein n=1 Tax=Azospirillum doebereinerae TaxID=92933 RepID=A0A433JF99_9PROT|nr:DUF2889 domain-containing protein [Azospirillum doebereinerae]MCG5243438.1 DUF2889 domain-containing protein [Azospirillum doebereinerae]RUQ75835.1 DUF2889 domain-containing protein [Azospirillum doebereinerae]
MPLSAPADREHIHTRRVTCQGFRRADGLWDIEGHLTDVKSYGFHTEERGRLSPGDPIHQMWMRMTVDDQLVVRAIEAVTDDSPYLACGSITPAFQTLVGLRIAAGWTQAVKQRLGGPKGCTHLVELLGPMATTAFQTVFPILAREKAAKAKQEGRPAHDGKERPVLLNMCHILSSDGDVARKNWPEHYTGTDREPAPQGNEAAE